MRTINLRYRSLQSNGYYGVEKLKEKASRTELGKQKQFARKPNFQQPKEQKHAEKATAGLITQQTELDSTVTLSSVA